MKKLIVSILVCWKLATWISEPCPLSMQNYDYGNQGGGSCCAVLHGHNEYTFHQKYFSTRKEAEDFIKNAPQNATDFTIKEAQ